jgi:hypothetical protein
MRGAVIPFAREILHGEPRKSLQNAKPPSRLAAPRHAAGRVRAARAPFGGGTSRWARPWAGSGEVEKERYHGLVFSERKMYGGDVGRFMRFGVARSPQMGEFSPLQLF